MFPMLIVQVIRFAVRLQLAVIIQTLKCGCIMVDYTRTIFEDFLPGRYKKPEIYYSCKR